MDLEAILDVMGCKTRREILYLLTQEPCFVSQISKELEIGQKAIIEHLRAMEDLGLLRSSFKKIERGRPRKYYDISQDIRIQIFIRHGLIEMHVSGDEFFEMRDIEEKIRTGRIDEAVDDLKKIIEKYEESKKYAQNLLIKLQQVQKVENGNK